MIDLLHLNYLLNIKILDKNYKGDLTVSELIFVRISSSFNRKKAPCFPHLYAEKIMDLPAVFRFLLMKKLKTTRLQVVFVFSYWKSFQYFHSKLLRPFASLWVTNQIY